MIEIRNLYKCFGDLQVLENISLTIHDGEIYGIIGQSGAGKSTLLRCINGLEKYEAGSITVDGREVGGLNTASLRALQKQMGMIFQIGKIFIVKMVNLSLLQGLIMIKMQET